jgi:hypothetical protein
MSRRNRPEVKRQRRTDRESGQAGHAVARQQLVPRPRVPRGQVALLRELNDGLRAAEMMTALDWLVHGVPSELSADIKARSDAVSESVLSLYAPLDSDTIEIVQQRITAATVLDAMSATEYDDDSGAAVERTLAAINRELGFRVGAA